MPNSFNSVHFCTVPWLRAGARIQESHLLAIQTLRSPYLWFAPVYRDDPSTFAMVWWFHPYPRRQCNSRHTLAYDHCHPILPVHHVSDVLLRQYGSDANIAIAHVHQIADCCVSVHGSSFVAVYVVLDDKCPVMTDARCRPAMRTLIFMGQCVTNRPVPAPVSDTSPSPHHTKRKKQWRTTTGKPLPAKLKDDTSVLLVRRNLQLWLTDLRSSPSFDNDL